MGKIKTWYKKQGPLLQLLITFLWNVLFWFVVSILGQIVVDEFNKTFVEKVIYTLLMSFFWVILFDWKLVKKLFSTSAKPNNADYE